MFVSKLALSDRKVKAFHNNNVSARADRFKTGSMFHLDETSKFRLSTTSLKNKIDYRVDTAAFIRVASRGAESEMAMGSDFSKAIDNFAKSKNKFLLLRNLPVDPFVPVTPTDGTSNLVKDTFVQEHMQAMVGTMLGAKYAVFPWKEQYTHPLFHVGHATPPRSTTLAAISNGKNLPYHLDLEGLRNVKAAPEYLFLGCLREGNDPYQYTKILDNTDILAQIPQQVQDDMKEARFILPNKTKAFVWPEIPQPILYEDVTVGPTLICMVDGPLAVLPADPDDPKAWRAIACLHAAIEKADAMGLAHKIHFQAGDLLIFRNQAVLHSRESSRPPKLDGTDRVLVRSYWMSYNTVAKMKGNSVLWTSFVDYQDDGNCQDDDCDAEEAEGFELI
jgi:L-asparagine oxygenase